MRAGPEPPSRRASPRGGLPPDSLPRRRAARRPAADARLDRARRRRRRRARSSPSACSSSSRACETNVDAAVRPRARTVARARRRRCSADRICDSVAARLGGRDLEVSVVAPILCSPLHYLADDEEPERRGRGGPAAAVVSPLRRRGCRRGARRRGRPPPGARPSARRVPGRRGAPRHRGAGALARVRPVRACARLVPVLEHVEAV